MPSRLKSMDVMAALTEGSVPLTVVSLDPLRTGLPAAPDHAWHFAARNATCSGLVGETGRGLAFLFSLPRLLLGR